MKNFKVAMAGSNLYRIMCSQCGAKMDEETEG